MLNVLRAFTIFDSLNCFDKNIITLLPINFPLPNRLYIFCYFYFEYSKDYVLINKNWDFYPIKLTNKLH